MIVELLTSPNLDNPMVKGIAEIYKKDHAEFEKTAREWTQKYAT